VTIPVLAGDRQARLQGRRHRRTWSRSRTLDRVILRSQRSIGAAGRHPVGQVGETDLGRVDLVQVCQRIDSVPLSFARTPSFTCATRSGHGATDTGTASMT